MGKTGRQDIEEVCKGKHVIIYGAGKGIGQFLEQYGHKVTLEAVIDNDRCKQGKKIGDIFSEAFQTKFADVQICSPGILSQYVPENVVVFVASAKRHREIEEDLQQKGLRNIYIISEMDFVQEHADVEKALLRYQEYCVSLPLASNKILFSSFANYADHEKYISESLMKLRTDLDIVWLVSDLDVELPDGVRKVLRGNWKKVLYEAETSRMWIADTAVPAFFVKRPEQIYMQTKHWASITLKKFYLDAITFQNESEKLASWRRESEIIDYIVVGSEFDRESCKRGFGVTGEFIMAGSPRTDGLFRGKQNREKVYAYYELADDVRVLMYAPTYRFSKEAGKSVHQSREIGFDYCQIKAILEKRFGGSWKIALRLHPSVRDAAKEMELPDFVFDVSTYEDSEELVSAFDIMVSDYSSLMFEPAFIKRPVFLYAADLEEYLVNEYELLISYKELPFDIAENTEQLCANILNFDKSEYEKRVETFLDKYGIKEDGHASERVAEFISALL